MKRSSFTQTPNSGSAEGVAPRSAKSSTSVSRQPRFRLRFLSWVLGAVVVGAVVLNLRLPVLPVEVAYVERGDLQVTVDEEGRTRVKERYQVSAPVTGRLQRIHWEPGDRIEAGELLAQIDPLPFDASIQSLQAELRQWQAQQQEVETLRPKTESIARAQAQIIAAQAQVEAAEAEVARAQAALDQAKRERQRAQDLEQSGVLAREQRELAVLEETTRKQEWEIAQKQLNSAQSQVAMAEAEVLVLEAEQADPDYLLQVYDARMAALEAELTRLQDDVARTQIRSPVSGQILRVLQEDHRMVAAGTPLLELGDPQDLELVVDVLSQEALQIQIGDSVWVDLLGDRIQVGQVARVEPAAFTKVSALGVEEQRVNVIIELTDQIPVAWGDGYRVDVQITIWEGKEVLKIPTSALFRCQSDWCVFRVDEEGLVRQQSIHVGPRNQREVVVEQGLVPDDPVHLYPSEDVEDGIRVRFEDRE